MEYGLYKRLCVLAGMVALCASCSVRRSASDHSHYRDQERQVLESLDTSMDVRLSSSNTVRDRWRNIRIIRREFDLERQPDENGRYPVKSETTLEGEEHENERKEEAESQKKEENESVFARSEASHEEERSGDTELNSDVGKNALGWWALGVTMVLALVIFLRWRYGKKDKTK